MTQTWMELAAILVTMLFQELQLWILGPIVVHMGLARFRIPRRPVPSLDGRKPQASATFHSSRDLNRDSYG